MADSNNQNDELNPGQTNADNKLNGSVDPSTAADLQDQEGNTTPGAGDGNVSDLESGIGVAPSSYLNKYTGKDRKIPGRKKAVALLRGGPLFVIGGGLGVAGVALFLLVPAFLFFHLMANMFDTYDPSSTALTQVTKLMILNKLGANEATIGICNTAKIACRFKTPSNELLRQLDAKGIKAYTTGADGKLKPLDIYTKSKWPTEKPTVFSFGSGNKRVTIDAKNLRSTLISNPEFRIAFNKTINKLGARAFTRFSPAQLKVMEKFKFRLFDKLSKSATEVKPGENAIVNAIKDAVKLKGPVGEAADDAARAAAWAADVELRVNKALTRVARASKGSGIILVMAMQCMANEIPGMVKKTMIAAQEAGLVAAAAPIATAITATQAGDGNPEVVKQLGEKFTEKTADGKDALQSIGIKYGLDHDKDTSTDPTYQYVTPAAFGDVLTAASIADQILKNPASNAACGLLMNPITGALVAAGINAALIDAPSFADFGISFALNAAVGLSITFAINSFGDGVGQALGSAVAPVLASAAQPALNKMDQPGPTFGNVFAAGLGIIAQNNGANTFPVAMTTDELDTYTKTTKEEQLADAEIDRATLSPLDASSQYTFLGTMVNQLMPYYSSLSSIGGSLSVLSSLLPISFGSVMKMSTASAADATSIYEDAYPHPEELKTASGKTRAANIFGHSVYAVNISDDWKPNDDLQAIVNADPDAINEDSGEPIVHDDALTKTFEQVTDLSAIVPVDLAVNYGDYIETCTDPENANDCSGDTETELRYARYNAANVVSTMIDTSASELPGNGEDSQDAAEQAFVMDYGDDSVAVDDTTETTTTQQSSFDIVSAVRDSLRSYGKSLFASAPITLTDTLTRFTLWR